MLTFDSPLEPSRPTGQTRSNSFGAEVNCFDAQIHLKYFEQRFPLELELFRLTGIHPNGSPSLPNPYTGAICYEDFKNIGEHCIAVAYCSEKIAQSLLEIGAIREAEYTHIVKRALVHDLAKPYEIMRRDAADAGLIDEVYTKQAYQDLKWLLIKQGMDHEIAEYIANSGSETSDTSLLELIVCKDKGFKLVPEHLPEKIVHLADDMTYTSIPEGGTRPLTFFLTFSERMLASQFAQRYPYLWIEGVAVGDNGSPIHIRDVTKLNPNFRLMACFAELGELVTDAICREVKLLLAPESQLAPELFVKNLVNGVLVR